MKYSFRLAIVDDKSRLNEPYRYTMDNIKDFLERQNKIFLSRNISNLNMGSKLFGGIPMPNEKECPNCGAFNEEEESFCFECGTNLSYEEN